MTILVPIPEVDPSMPVLYFTIRYRPVNITGSPSDWVQVPARIPPNVRFYRLTGLQPGTDYEIVVRAHNAQGPSLPSKPLEESTLEEGEGRVDIPGRVLSRSICQREGGVLGMLVSVLRHMGLQIVLCAAFHIFGIYPTQLILPFP